MRNWSIAKKLISGFAVLLTLLISISVTCITRSKTILQDTENVSFVNTLENSLLKLESGHLLFMTNAQRFFIDQSAIKMDVETDDHQCGLGKWLYGEKRQQAETELPELVPILKKLEKPHTDLHGSILEINTLVSDQGRSQAMEQIQAIFNKITEPSLTKVQEGIGQVISILETYSEKENTLLHTISASTQTHVLLLSICAVIIGIVVAWFLIRTITKSVKSVLNTTMQLTDGNMTVRSEIFCKDEIGKLSNATNKLAEQFNNNLMHVRGSASTIRASSSTLNSLAEKLSSSADGMAGNALTVSTAAEEMNTNMSAIAAASEETSINVSHRSGTSQADECRFSTV